MRSITIIFLLLLTFSCKPTKITSVSMYDDVAVLAHDSMMGRQVGTEYERKAAAYIAQRFSDLKLQPKGVSNYYQDFAFKRSANPHKPVEFVDDDVQNTKNTGLTESPSQTVMARKDRKSTRLNSSHVRI